MFTNLLISEFYELDKKQKISEEELNLPGESHNDGKQSTDHSHAKSNIHS